MGEPDVVITDYDNASMYESNIAPAPPPTVHSAKGGNTSNTAGELDAPVPSPANYTEPDDNRKDKIGATEKNIEDDDGHAKVKVTSFPFENKIEEKVILETRFEEGRTTDTVERLSSEIWEKLTTTKLETDGNQKKGTKPKMVFSVLGDSENFVPKPWPKSLFQKALTDAARCAGDCWILYRNKEGSYVSDVVREAVELYQTVEESEEERSMIKLIGLSVDKAKGSRSETEELGLVLEFENSISKKYGDFFGITKYEMKIPVVLIVVEGGLNTIRHIVMAITHNLPVIVVKGSGKASDLIAECLQSLDLEDIAEPDKNKKEPAQNTTETTKNKTKSILRMKFPVLFGSIFNKEKGDEIEKLLYEIFQKPWLVTVFDLSCDDAEKLSDLAGEAVVRAWAYDEAEKRKEKEGDKEKGEGEKLQVPNSGITREYTEYIPRVKEDGKSVVHAILQKAQTRKEGRKNNYILNPLSSDRYRLPHPSRSPTSLPLYFYMGFQYIEDIDNYEKENVAEITKENLEVLLKEALRTNRSDYVEVLLNRIKERPPLLCYLYESTILCKEEISCEKCGAKFSCADSAKGACKKSNRSQFQRNNKVQCENYKSKCKHDVAEKCPHLGMYWILQNVCKDTTNELLSPRTNVGTRRLADGKCKHCEKIIEVTKCEDEVTCLCGECRKEPIMTLPMICDRCNEIRAFEMAQILCRMLLGYELIACCLPFHCCCHACHYPDKIGERKIHKYFRKLKENEKEGSEKDKIKEEYRHFLQQLLLWAILANRKEIAGIVWRMAPNQLLAAEMSAVLLRELSERANDVKQQMYAKELEDHAVLFENRCLALMDGMYDSDEKDAMELLDDVQTVWGITTTPKTFAYDNFMYDVIAHPCTQRLLNKQWFDSDAPHMIPFLKGIFSKHFFSSVKAPVARFWYNYIFFTLMLVCYSSFVMTSVDDTNYRRSIAKIWEYYVYIWAGNDLLEELHAFGAIWTWRESCRCKKGGDNKSKKSFSYRLWKYFSDFWNIVDVVSYVLLIAALFVRHFAPGDFVIPRRLFGLSMLVMFLRYLQIFMPFKRTGVTLILIKEMLKDLLYFLLILLVVLMGVGIYYHANLYPSHLAIFGPGEFKTWSFWKIIYYPYFQIYGEFNLDYLQGTLDGCSSNRTEWENNPYIERCPEEDWSVVAVAMAFLLVANLLLVNLVIAMFSYTFDKVQTNSERLWRFERFTLVTDYKRKIPAPFSFLRLFKCVYSRLKHCCKKPTPREGQDKRRKRQDLIAARIST